MFCARLVPMASVQTSIEQSEFWHRHLTLWRETVFRIVSKSLFVLGSFIEFQTIITVIYSTHSSLARNKRPKPNSHYHSSKWNLPESRFVFVCVFFSCASVVVIDIVASTSAVCLLPSFSFLVLLPSSLVQLLVVVSVFVIEFRSRRLLCLFFLHSLSPRIVFSVPAGVATRMNLHMNECTYENKWWIYW